jgi:superfamily II DNA or RNA helicase
MESVPELREYQADVVERIRATFGAGKRRVVLRSEVGSGKTIIFSYIASKSKAPVMVVCNRQKLVRQSERQLKRFGLKPYVLMQTGMPPVDTKLIVASADTLRHREWPSWVRMVIIDECHLANFTKVLDVAVERDLFVLGVSATPIPNKSNKLDQYYQDMLCTLPTAQHILDGDLILDCYYAPRVVPDLTGIGTHKTAYGNDYNEKMLYAAYNKPKVYDDMIQNWLKMCKGMRTVCFCISVEHSKNTAENFRRHGISAIHLDGNSSEAERDDAQMRFERGDYQVLCNCAIFTFGWDCPSIECVIVNRATASYELWRQMIGRGARPSGEKEVFWVIDQGGNYRRHGGLVDEVEWSLNPPKKKKKYQLGVSPRKECPKCEALVPTTTMICPKCGHEWPQKAASLIQGAEFEVVVAKPLTTWPVQSDYADISEFVRDCIRFAKQKSYHSNSILHQIKHDSSAIQAYAKIKGYKQGWEKHQRALSI